MPPRMQKSAAWRGMAGEPDAGRVFLPGKGLLEIRKIRKIDAWINKGIAPLFHRKRNMLWNGRKFMI